MRIYVDFKKEALGEIKRDLVEMGIKIHPKSYQDKIVEHDPAFDTLEIQNYTYTVINPRTEDLTPTQPWADAEFRERITRPPVNPGEAWELRKEVWTEFRCADGKFGYNYPERFAQYDQIERIIKRIKVDPDSRQLFLAVYQPSDIQYMGGVSRIPCTIGYQIQIRSGLLHLTYIQRSCDFATHYNNDVYLAVMMQRYIAEKTGYRVGRFTHFVMSLHLFKKDGKGVF
jgi:thymidylate synthase